MCAWKYVLQKQGFGIVSTNGRQECEPFPLPGDEGRLFGYTDIDNILDHAGQAQTTTGKIRVKSAVAKYECINNTNAPILVKFFKCLARRDLSTQVAPNNYVNPATAFRYGVKDQQSDATNVLYRVPGFTPYMVQSFCQFWKIYGKPKSFWLPAGGLKTVYLKAKNVTIDRIPSNSPGVIVFKGLTRAPLFLVRGVQGREATQNQWSYGPAELSVVRTETYKFMDTIGLMEQNPSVYNTAETNFSTSVIIDRISPTVPTIVAGTTVGTLP